MKDWFYLLDEEQHGPIAEDQLLLKLNSGEIPHHAFVWRDGLSEALTGYQFIQERSPAEASIESEAQDDALEQNTCVGLEVLPPLLPSPPPVPVAPHVLLIRRIAWIGVTCIGLSLSIPVCWISWNAMERSRQARIAREYAAQQERLQEEQQLREAQDPTMRARTKAVWRDINEVTDKVNDLARQETDPATICQKKAHWLALIDADGAEPYLGYWIRASIENSKELMQLCEVIRKDHAGQQQLKQGTEKFFTVLGTLVGALADNGRSASENMQLGTFAGQLSGQGAGLLVDSLGAADLDRKYKPAIERLTRQEMTLKQQRSELLEFINRKYGLTMFETP